jgi:hypothetical protein
MPPLALCLLECRFAEVVGTGQQYAAMGEVLLGSEAVARGVVTRHELARWYRPILPNVHAAKGQPLDVRDNTVAAWLWSRRNAVISGVAASALHGAAWVDDDVPIELTWSRRHPPRGVIVRTESLADDEVTKVCGLPVTTRARTAFDLGRHLPRMEAIARLDALMRAAPFSSEEVLILAKRYCGARGLRQLRELLPLVDAGAASPRESRLRLKFIDAGLPKPKTQILVLDNGQFVRWLDMGWEHFLVAAEYDGEQHQTSRDQYVKDMRVHPKLQRLGWNVIRAIKEDRDDDVVQRAWDAMISRGWKPPRGRPRRGRPRMRRR